MIFRFFTIATIENYDKKCARIACARIAVPESCVPEARVPVPAICILLVILLALMILLMCRSHPLRQMVLIIPSNVVAKEQQEDETLKGCFTLARAGKGGYEVHDGLLYHRRTETAPISCSLVPPEARS